MSLNPITVYKQSVIYKEEKSNLWEWKLLNRATIVLDYTHVTSYGRMSDEFDRTLKEVVRA
jgi:peroxiredoxin